MTPTTSRRVKENAFGEHSLHQGLILEGPEVMSERMSEKRMAQESRKDFGTCRRVETLVRSIISREGREQAELADDGADG